MDRAQQLWLDAVFAARKPAASGATRNMASWIVAHPHPTMSGIYLVDTARVMDEFGMHKATAVRAKRWLIEQHYIEQIARGVRHRHPSRVVLVTRTER